MNNDAAQALVDQFETPEKRAEDIFQRMDVNSDGRVTRQEFVRSCINDSNLAQLLSPKYVKSRNLSFNSAGASAIYNDKLIRTCSDQAAG